MTSDSKYWWAWLAGFMDGEGYIGLYPNRSVYRARIGLSNTNREVLEVVQDKLGGHLGKGFLGKDNWKVRYNWELGNYKALCYVLPRIEPFSLIKRDRVLLLQEYLTLWQPRMSSPLPNRAHEIYKEIRRLNTRGDLTKAEECAIVPV